MKTKQNEGMGVSYVINPKNLCSQFRSFRLGWSILMRMKEESEKAGLKLIIQKRKIKASGPITSWQIDGETMETVANFIFLGSKITSEGNWSQEIKRCLLFGRKAMTSLDSILKSRDIALPTKVHLVKAVIFSVVMWELDYKESSSKWSHSVRSDSLWPHRL